MFASDGIQGPIEKVEIRSNALYLQLLKRYRVLLIFSCLLQLVSINDTSAKCIEGQFGHISLNGKSDLAVLPANDNVYQSIINSDDLSWMAIPEIGYHSKMSNDGYLVKARFCKPSTGKYFLLLDDANIYEVRIYLKSLRTDELINIGFSREGKSSSNAVIHHRLYVFEYELHSDEDYELFIYSRETNGTIWTDYEIYTEHEFIDYLVDEEKKVGFLMGCMVILLVISVVIWSATFSGVFFYYALYLFGSLLFGAATLGLVKFYFPESSNLLSDSISWLSAYLMISMMLAISKTYLNFKIKLPKINALFNFLIWFYIIGCLLMIILDTLMGKIPDIFLSLPYPTMASQPFVLFGSLMYYFIKTRDRKALNLVLIFGLSIITIAVLALRPIIGAPVGIFDYLRWIILVEVFVIFLLLFRDNAQDIFDKLKISSLLLDKKSKQIDALLAARRNERLRISNFLHNRIGLKMGAVKLGLNNEHDNTSNISELIDEISQEIRMVSHNLNPEILHKKGIVAAIEQEIFRIEDVYPKLIFKLDLTSTADILSKEQSEVIYNCFLELTQNIIKHNKVTSLDINLVCTSDDITLALLDDGFQYDTGVLDTGSGFRRIKTELLTINGELLVSNREGTQGMEHKIILRLD